MTFGHGGEIRIGEWCYVGEGTRIWSAGSIEIGNRVLISHSVNVFDNLTIRSMRRLGINKSGRFSSVAILSTFRWMRTRSRSVTMPGLAQRAMILRGVTVGEGGVVAAGAVVTKDVLPYSIVAGNPAEFVRKLSSDAG